MSSVSLPVTRTTGRAILVGAAPTRARALAALGEMGFTCVESDEPYGAVAELSRRPQIYEAMVLSLPGVYLEELQLVATIKRRFPHVEVWLTDTDGRPAGLAEAVRFGADGLLGADGLHRIALAAGPAPAAAPAPTSIAVPVAPIAAAPPPVAPPPPAPPAPAPPAAACAEVPPVDRPAAQTPAAALPVRARGSRRSRHASDSTAASPAEVAARPAQSEKPGKGGAGRRRPQETIDDWDGAMVDAVLTAEELRALLHEQPTAPPVAGEE